MRQPPPSQKTVTDDQREKLLAASPAWLRFAILLYADHGLRFASAAKAKLSDFNAETGILTVETKGGFRQLIPLTGTLRHFVATLPRDAAQDQTVIQLLAGKAFSPAAIRRQFQRSRKKAGIETINPHDFRRTVATKAWKATHDIRIVQQILGHQSLHSTARYIVDEQPEELRGLLEQLKPQTEMKQ